MPANPTPAAASEQEVERLRKENAALHAPASRDFTPAEIIRIASELHLCTDEVKRQPTFGKIEAEVSKLSRRCEGLLQDAATAKDQLGKLLGTAKTYCDSPAQIKGEAYRDMAETLAWIGGEREDLLGWPACYERVKAERDAANELYNSSATTTNVQKSVIDDLRLALLHLAYRTHPHSDDCSGCKNLERELRIAALAERGPGQESEE